MKARCENCGTEIRRLRYQRKLFVIPLPWFSELETFGYCPQCKLVKHITFQSMPLPDSPQVPHVPVETGK